MDGNNRDLPAKGFAKKDSIFAPVNVDKMELSAASVLSSDSASSMCLPPEEPSVLQEIRATDKPDCSKLNWSESSAESTISHSRRDGEKVVQVFRRSAKRNCVVDFTLNSESSCDDVSNTDLIVPSNGFKTAFRANSRKRISVALPSEDESVNNLDQTSMEGTFVSDGDVTKGHVNFFKKRKLNRKETDFSLQLSESTDASEQMSECQPPEANETGLEEDQPIINNATFTLTESKNHETFDMSVDTSCSNARLVEQLPKKGEMGDGRNESNLNNDEGAPTKAEPLRMSSSMDESIEASVFYHGNLTIPILEPDSLVPEVNPIELTIGDPVSIDELTEPPLVVRKSLIPSKRRSRACVMEKEIPEEISEISKSPTRKVPCTAVRSGLTRRASSYGGNEVNNYLAGRTLKTHDVDKSSLFSKINRKLSSKCTEDAGAANVVVSPVKTPKIHTSSKSLNATITLKTRSSNSTLLADDSSPKDDDTPEINRKSIFANNRKKKLSIDFTLGNEPTGDETDMTELVSADGSQGKDLLPNQFIAPKSIIVHESDNLSDTDILKTPNERKSVFVKKRNKRMSVNFTLNSTKHSSPEQMEVKGKKVDSSDSIVENNGNTFEPEIALGEKVKKSPVDGDISLSTIQFPAIHESSPTAFKDTAKSTETSDSNNELINLNNTKHFSLETPDALSTEPVTKSAETYTSISEKVALPKTAHVDAPKAIPVEGDLSVSTVEFISFQVSSLEASNCSTTSPEPNASNGVLIPSNMKHSLEQPHEPVTEPLETSTSEGIEENKKREIMPEAALDDTAPAISQDPRELENNEREALQDTALLSPPVPSAPKRKSVRFQESSPKILNCSAKSPGPSDSNHAEPITLNSTQHSSLQRPDVPSIKPLETVETSTSEGAVNNIERKASPETADSVLATPPAPSASKRKSVRFQESSPKILNGAAKSPGPSGANNEEPMTSISTKQYQLEEPDFPSIQPVTNSADTSTSESAVENNEREGTALNYSAMAIPLDSKELKNKKGEASPETVVETLLAAPLVEDDISPSKRKSVTLQEPPQALNRLEKSPEPNNSKESEPIAFNVTNHLSLEQLDVLEPVKKLTETSILKKDERQLVPPAVETPKAIPPVEGNPSTSTKKFVTFQESSPEVLNYSVRSPEPSSGSNNAGDDAAQMQMTTELSRIPSGKGQTQSANCFSSTPFPKNKHQDSNHQFLVPSRPALRSSIAVDPRPPEENTSADSIPSDCSLNISIIPKDKSMPKSRKVVTSTPKPMTSRKTRNAKEENQVAETVTAVNHSVQTSRVLRSSRSKSSSELESGPPQRSIVDVTNVSLDLNNSKNKSHSVRSTSSSARKSENVEPKESPCIPIPDETLLSAQVGSVTSRGISLRSRTKGSSRSYSSHVDRRSVSKQLFAESTNAAGSSQMKSVENTDSLAVAGPSTYLGNLSEDVDEVRQASQNVYPHEDDSAELLPYAPSESDAQEQPCIDYSARAEYSTHFSSRSSTCSTSSFGSYSDFDNPLPRSCKKKSSSGRPPKKNNSVVVPLPRKTKNSTPYGSQFDNWLRQKRKMFKPAKWVTKKLYSFLEKHLAARFGLDKRLKAEEVVLEMLHSYNQVKAGHVDGALDRLVKKLHELEILTTHFEFYTLLDKFMPYHYQRHVLSMPSPLYVNSSERHPCLSLI